MSDNILSWQRVEKVVNLYRDSLGPGTLYWSAECKRLLKQRNTKKL